MKMRTGAGGRPALAAELRSGGCSDCLRAVEKVVPQCSAQISNRGKRKGLTDERAETLGE